MALPEVPELARAMLSRLGPKAMATLEAMLDDPKLSARDRLAVIQMIMARYFPEPKVDSAASRRPALITLQSDPGFVVLERARARIAARQIEPIDPEPISDEQEEPTT